MTNTSSNIGSISWAINVSKTSYNEVIKMEDWRLRKCDIRLRDWAKENLSEDKPYILGTAEDIAKIYETVGNLRMAKIRRCGNTSQVMIWRISDVVMERRNGRRVLDIQPVR